MFYFSHPFTDAFAVKDKLKNRILSWKCFSIPFHQSLQIIIGEAVTLSVEQLKVNNLRNEPLSHFNKSKVCGVSQKVNLQYSLEEVNENDSLLKLLLFGHFLL
jgi:hypothetical protein